MKKYIKLVNFSKYNNINNINNYSLRIRSTTIFF